MQLKLKAHPKNTFPLRGLLIKSASVKDWIKEIQLLQYSMKELEIYPIPDTTPNSIWGCFVLLNNPINTKKVGRHEIVQMVSNNLFIPEKSILVPSLTIAETEKLFPGSKHIYHPVFGMVELTEVLDLEKILQKPVIKSYYVSQPEPSIFIPKQIKSFQIKPVSPEEVLKNMEKVFPKNKKFEDKPLNPLEKVKLGIYKMLFTKTKDETGKAESSVEKTGLMAKMASFMDKMLGKENKFADKMQQDFEDLEKRNQKQIDKLMDLFKNNPEEALKYAIPLDEKGSSRGGQQYSLDLSKRWFDFSLLGGGGNFGSGDGSINLGEYYNDLRNQYNKTAEDFIRQKEYHKAAFVYMKLLQNHHLAAQTLENGECYQEAATLYIKHCNNKPKAAECYEKGKMTDEAIGLYKELNQNEKVGDLYVGLRKRKEADIYYTKVIDDYKTRSQYVKASLIYKNKMNNEQGGQSILMEGWRSNCDAINCLNNYFSNINDIKVLKTEIDNIYSKDVSNTNSESFLQVIRHEYNKKNELEESIRDLAYEIIAERIKENPAIVSELKSFNKSDKELVKDTLRFKVGKTK